MENCQNTESMDRCQIWLPVGTTGQPGLVVGQCHDKAKPKAREHHLHPKSSEPRRNTFINTVFPLNSAFHSVSKQNHLIVSSTNITIWK